MKYELGDQKIIVESHGEKVSINAKAYDPVQHPLHYNQGGIECIDAIKAATVGKKGIEAVCVANAIKYLWRFEARVLCAVA